MEFFCWEERPAQRRFENSLRSNEECAEYVLLRRGSGAGRVNRKRNPNERRFPARKRALSRVVGDPRNRKQFPVCSRFRPSAGARKIEASCEKRLFIAFFRSRHADDVVQREWPGIREARSTRNAQKKVVFFPSRAAIARTIEPTNGWRGSSATFFSFFHSIFYEDQLVRYINDCAARIIRPGFLRAGPSSADGLFRKIDCVSASRRSVGKRENTTVRSRGSIWNSDDG